MFRNLTVIAAVAALFFVAVSLTSPPASADWVGSIITERPAGQAASNGLLDFSDPDNPLIVINNDPASFVALTFSGHGSVAATILDAYGEILAEKTCVGSVKVSIRLTEKTTSPEGHAVQMVAIGGCKLFIDMLVLGDSVLIELLGGFTCRSTSGCAGTQNGRLIFKLTVE